MAATIGTTNAQRMVTAFPSMAHVHVAVVGKYFKAGFTAVISWLLLEH